MRLVPLMCVFALACTSGREPAGHVGRSAAPAKKIASMAKPRVFHNLVELPDGRVFTGPQSDYPYDECEIYDPTSDKWTTTAKVDAFYAIPAVLLSGGRPALLPAATDGHGEIYDSASNKWSTTKGAAATRRFESTVTMLADGRFLLAGGLSDATGASVSTSEIYDPTSDAFEAVGPLADKRVAHAAMLLADGRVLVIGGKTDGTTDGLSSVEIFDAGTKTFTKAASMKVARGDAVAVRLGSGKVLVAGGTTAADAGVSSAEVFDAKTGTWTLVDSMTSARRRAFGVVLPDGRVMVGGGVNTGVSDTFSTTEIFDPASEKWSPGPSLTHPRSLAAAIVLSSGDILIAGGADDVGSLSTAEIIEGKASSGDAGLTDAGGVDAGGVDASGVGPIARPDYRTCKFAADCASGFCVDGVCCDTKCDGPCTTCALPSQPGKCVPQPYGIDLRHECGPAASCTATCNGSGACVPMRGGEQCAQSKCTDASHGVGPSVCAALGAACGAASATPFDCGPYTCEPAFGACNIACVTSDQCAPGNVCDVALKTCAPAAPSEDSGGCSFGAPRDASWMPIALLFALQARRRRRLGCAATL